jgi:hypothetical protein
MAAGVSLVLSAEAPSAAAWFITGGLAAYLMGTRGVAIDWALRFGTLPRAPRDAAAGGGGRGHRLPRAPDQVLRLRPR